MSKITLNNVTNGQNIANINSNFTKIANALNTQVFYRVNPVGEPNTLTQTVDGNGQAITNVSTLYTQSLVLNGADVVTTFGDINTSKNTAVAAANSATTSANSASASAGLSLSYSINAYNSAAQAAASAATAGAVSGSGSFIQVGSGAITRSNQDRLRETVNAKDFGAVSDGVTDNVGVFLKLSSLGKDVLFTEGSYYLDPTSLATLPGGKFTLSAGTRWISSSRHKATFVTTYGANPLIYSASPNSGIFDIAFDFSGSTAARRVINADVGATNFEARSLKISNMNSSTFIQAVWINDAVNNFKVDGLEFYNLYATPNSVIGDLNGSCRGIYIGGNGVTPSSIGYGKVENIYGENIQTVEDGDLIHVQSSYAGNFPVRIRKISGRNVAKRLVKVQAQGVDVDDVSADSIGNSVEMYAVVSAYNDNCSVTRIRGIGQFRVGVDTNGSVLVDNVDINNLVGNIAGYGVVNDGLGSSKLSNIRVRGGFRRAVSITSTLGIIDLCEITDVSGVVSEELVYVSAESTYNITEVTLSEIRGGSTSNTKRSIFIRNAGLGGAVMTTKIDIMDVKNGGYFNTYDITANTVIANMIKGGGSSDTLLSITGATWADVRNVAEYGTTAAYGVNYLNCSNTYTDGIRTRQPTTAGNGVRFNGGDSHVWTNVYVPAGVTAVGVTGGATNVYGGRSASPNGALRVNDFLTRASGNAMSFTGLGALGWGATITHAYNDNPMRLGSNYLWVDSANRLRIKSSAPTSDTDGSVVGTQS